MRERNAGAGSVKKKKIVNEDTQNDSRFRTREKTYVTDENGNVAQSKGVFLNGVAPKSGAPRESVTANQDWRPEYQKYQGGQSQNSDPLDQRPSYQKYSGGQRNSGSSQNRNEAKLAREDKQSMQQYSDEYRRLIKQDLEKSRQAVQGGKDAASQPLTKTQKREFVSTVGPDAKRLQKQRAGEQLDGKITRNEGLASKSYKGSYLQTNNYGNPYQENLGSRYEQAMKDWEGGKLKSEPVNSTKVTKPKKTPNKPTNDYQTMTRPADLPGGRHTGIGRSLTRPTENDTELTKPASGTRLTRPSSGTQLTPQNTKTKSIINTTQKQTTQKPKTYGPDEATRLKMKRDAEEKAKREADKKYGAVYGRKAGG